MDRLTYKSAFGDYGVHSAEPKDLYVLYNKLGEYEDVGTPEQFRFLRDRFIEEQEEAPAPLTIPCEYSPGDFSAAMDMEGWVK